MAYSRRKFISFLGQASVGAMVLPPFLAACGNSNTPKKKASPEQLEALKNFVIKGVIPSDKDDLLLADGLEYQLLLEWKDAINEEDYFGFNNDFVCYIPLDADTPNEGWLWVNHEYVNPFFVSGYDGNGPKTKEQVDQEMYNVGGSVVRIRKENGKWKPLKNHADNRRFTSQTPIALNWDHPVAGATEVRGTNSNCSGGITPWNTFLSCEENYQDCFGERVYDANNQASLEASYYGWEQQYNYPTEHYGWVVEVDPKTGTAQKHVALGRFAHECCTLYELEDKRIVAYSGDDKADEHLYKFIGSKPGSLKEGTLYVADTVNGVWLSMDWASQPKLKARFKDQTEVLVRAREAAKLLGATPLNRPEDIEIDPITGHVIVSLTNNKSKGDYHGSLLKVVEKDGAFDALTFTASTYMAGGEENGFSCPDNLAFDFAGNLWMTSDISGSAMNKEDKPYMAFKNNGLFVIPRVGAMAGKVIQVASAPRDAELTGPWFAPDGKTLFLSVQHPGEQTKDLSAPTSTWPHNPDKMPKPAVVAITGPLIEKMHLLGD
ncbi:MAG: DUF839 domain-containing protein [Flavobacteriaceae bacterium]|nr:DUF839 domain-containing protein [Flavobacteriaceae bacterium]